MIYQGKPGKPVKTLADLQKLAENRKSVAIMHTAKFARGRYQARNIGVLPAKTILYRQCAGVIRLLESDTMFEYIKPTPIPRSTEPRRYTRKQGKKEGIRRILTIMQEFDGHSTDAYGLLYILEGMDPVMANRIRDDNETMYPDLKKAEAELKELEEV